MINLSDYYKSADGSNLIFNNGNNNGADIVIGTNDNYNLALEAGGIRGLILTSDTLSGVTLKTSFGAASASGLNSFAEGGGIALGNYSHAEGYLTIASGFASHAEGAGNTAQGYASHSEGVNTLAAGTYAHAEGLYNVAYEYAHAEGYYNVAAGYGSHAEGTQNTASGHSSHAEGNSNATGRRNEFLTYTASTRTFTFASSVSANFTFVIPGMILRGFEDYNTGEYFTITVSSRNNINGNIVATEDVIGGDSPSGYLIDNSGEGAHAEGSGTTASGTFSHSEGVNTLAVGRYSHAAGSYAEAAYDRSWIWKGSTATNIISTTRTDQFMVSAAGGVYIPGNVGIGTAANDQALTVVGTVSTAGNLFSPSFATFVKNTSYPTLSSTLTNNSGYFNSQGTFASPGGFIIKGHSPDYNTSIQNLPGKGTYGLWLQNVDNMDPGTTFASDGRAQVTHAMAFRAGINNFTAGSDHNHVQWQGAPSNSTQAWQMTNGGNATNVYGYQFPYTNRFMVHTLPQYQYNTTITAISGFIDTREANLVTGTDNVSGVKLLVSRDVSTGNYNLLNVGEVIGLTVNPGLVGLVAATYNSQVTQISANATLSSFQFNAYIGNGDNWKPAQKGIQPISLLSRTDGGNPGVSLVTSQIGTDPNTQYVGLTGSYRGINKHMLARFTSSALLTAYKTGAPLTLWIPPLMPSSSPIGTGIISSDKITSFTQGTFPTGVRSGYFDAYVINVSGADLEFALCNLMDSYSFENRSWPFSASGIAGWLLYGGSQDTVHRPTFGTTGFYFEREPWNVGSVNWLSGGMVKNVVLGTSESYGNFSYGLGWRGVVLGDKSGTFAGDYNTVFGNNSVALGGEGLISLSSTPYQAVVGKYNDPNNNALFVVGAGTSNTNRTNILEVEASKVTINGAISSNGVITVLDGNSNQWNSNYTTTKDTSAAWSNWSSVSGNYALGTQYVKLSGDTMTGGLSTVALSTNDVYGSSSQTVFTDGSSLAGNGTGTLTLNYANGIFTTNNITAALFQDTLGRNSTQWNSNYTTFNANSAKYNSNYTSFNTNSAKYDSNYTSFNSNSAKYDSVYTSTNASSAKYDSVYTSFNSNSAKYDSNYTSFNSNSAKYDSVHTSTNASSANWNAAYAYTSTFPLLTAMKITGINLGSNGLTNAFVVPAGKIFIATGLTVVFDSGTSFVNAIAGAIRLTRGGIISSVNRVMNDLNIGIATYANNTMLRRGSINDNNVAAQSGETVQIAMNPVTTSYTATVLIEGVLY